MKNYLILVLLIVILPNLFGQKVSLNEKILATANEEIVKYQALYIDLHRNPELSLMEFETSKKMANELRSIGFEVTTGIGGNGIVGVFRNGKGKVIMFRTDMDALPVKENTGLPFSSHVVTKDSSGIEIPVMHACGHDLHMSIWLGTLRTLISLKNDWQGTIIAVAQPAEEISGGSNAMIKDGLFSRFPRPDYAICYHVSAELPTGTIGYFPGTILAGTNSADITVYGIGGHGAMPQNTIDPVVLSARIILDIQTIVSREINPVKPAVVTVGAIHGGTKHNIIPDEVKMMLTIRFFDDIVYKKIRDALVRITRGDAIAAGLPENKMPLVKFEDQYTPPVANDPALVLNVAKYMKSILGEEKVIQVDPSTGAEDFGKYGRTDEKIPIALFWVGGVNAALYKDHVEKGTYLPSLHSSSFAPDFIPTFKCGVPAMSRAIIDLFSNNK